MSGLVLRLSSIPFRQLRSPNLRPQAIYAVSLRKTSVESKINKKPISFEEKVGFCVIGMVGLYGLFKMIKVWSYSSYDKENEI